MKLSCALALALLPGCLFAQIALTPVPKMQFLDLNGHPLAGGLVYTCPAGTSCPGTPLTTYSNQSGTPNSNPIVLDIGGFASIYLSTASSYKITVQSSAGVTIYTQDNVSAASGGGGGGGSGTVTNVSVVSVPSWLASNVANPASTPGITLSVNGGQTPHQVIGTCGTSSVFVPCDLTFDDIGDVLAVAKGGTGTDTPSLVAGSNITVTGTWPNQTITATGGGGGGGVTSVNTLTGAVVLPTINPSGENVIVSGTTALTFGALATYDASPPSAIPVADFWFGRVPYSSTTSTTLPSPGSAGLVAGQEVRIYSFVGGGLTVNLSSGVSVNGSTSAITLATGKWADYTVATSTTYLSAGN